jgi:hypothetical protein
LLRGILIPRQYTKLDSLLDIVSFVAQDISEETAEEPVEEKKPADRTGAYVSKLNRAQLRSAAKEFLLARIGQGLKEVSRTLLETQDGRVGVCYSPSQAYAGASYSKFWFGLHDHQIDFMSQHPEGFAAYLCAGAGMLFMPWNEFAKHIPHMLESSKDTRHWRHVVLQLGKDGKLRMRLRADAAQTPVDVSKWFVKM